MSIHPLHLIAKAIGWGCQFSRRRPDAQQAVPGLGPVAGSVTQMGMTPGLTPNHYDAIIPCKNNYRGGQKEVYKKSNNDDHAFLTLPFISEQMSKKLKSPIASTNLNIRLIQKPDKILKEWFPTTNTSHCKRKNCITATQLNNISCVKQGVIYELKCTNCDSKYIGETGRPLHIRMDEHDRHIRLHHEDLSAMAAHWLHHHLTQIGEPGSHFTIRILDSEKSTSKRKIKETIYIEQMKPKINTNRDNLVLL